MNKSILAFILLFTIIGNRLFAQNNELIARISNLNKVDAKEVVETEDVDLITAPTELDDNTTISFDINYLRKYKRIKLAIRFGYDFSSLNGETTIVRDNNYYNLLNNSKDRSLRIGLGIYQPVFESINGKASIRFSIFCNYGYKFEDSSRLASELFDEADAYLGGSLKELNTASSWRISLDAGSTFYYYFIPNAGLGLEFNIGVYYDRLKGDTKQNQVRFDQDKGIIEKINSTHHESKNTFGKSNPFSIAISYRF